MATPSEKLDSAAPHAGAKVFISYSRRDVNFVRRVFETLEAHQLGAWVDWEGIPPSAEWWGEIQRAIDGAEAFIFIMSPDSLSSAVCQDELAHAVKHNKRLVPLLYREIDAANHADATIPPTLARINWIYFRDADDFAAASAKLVLAIETDLEWVRAHTRLLERAVEWEAAKRDSSFLLQKNDLTLAEGWLSRGPEKDPKPTTLQAEYIISSRAYAVRRRRQLWTGVGIALFLLAVASLVAAWQYRLSETRREEALSRRLVAQVDELMERDQWDLGLLLGLHANNIFPTAEAAGALLQALNRLRGVRQILPEVYDPSGPLALSNDGKLLLAAVCREPVDSWTCPQGEALVLRTDSGTAVAKFKLPTQVISAAFDGQGRRLALAFSDAAAPSRVNDSEGNAGRSDAPFSVSVFDLPTGLAQSSNAIVLGPAKLQLTATGQPLQRVSFIGKELILGQSDRLFVWRLADGSLAQSIPLHADAISPDASTALVLDQGSPDTSGHVELWDIRQQARKVSVIRVPPAMSQQAAFNGDGETIVLLTCRIMASGRHCQGELRLIDRKTARVLEKFIEREAEIDPILAIASPRRGRWFVSGGCGASTQTEACLYGRLNFWKAEKYGIEEYARPARTYGGQVQGLAISGDGKTFASISSRGTIALWRADAATLEATQLLPSILQTQRSSRSLLGQLSGGATPSASAKGAVRNLERSSIRCRGEGPLHPILFAAAHRLNEPKQVCSAGAALAEIWDYGWDPGRQTLAVAGCAAADSRQQCSKGRIELWSIRDGALRKQRDVETKARVTSFALDLDRNQIAAAICARGSYEECANSSSVELVRFGDPSPSTSVLLAKANLVTSLAINRNGETLAFATCVGFPESGPPTGQCAAGGIQFMNLRTGEVQDGMLLGHQQAVSAMSFSPAGDVLMSGGLDGSIAFADPSARQRLGPVIPGHLVSVAALAFVSDTAAVSESEDDAAEWIANPGEWKKIACRLLKRGLTDTEARQYLGGNSSSRNPCGQTGAGPSWLGRWIGR